LPITIGVVRETFPGERRVALVPRAMDILAKSGVGFAIEAGAGAAAGFPDAEYLEKGENPRYVVTSLAAEEWPAQPLYDVLP